MSTYFTVLLNERTLGHYYSIAFAYVDLHRNAIKMIINNSSSDGASDA